MRGYLSTNENARCQPCQRRNTAQKAEIESPTHECSRALCSSRRQNGIDPEHQQPRPPNREPHFHTFSNITGQQANNTTTLNNKRNNNKKLKQDADWNEPTTCTRLGISQCRTWQFEQDYHSQDSTRYWCRQSIGENCNRKTVSIFLVIFDGERRGWWCWWWQVKVAVSGVGGS